MCFYEPSPGPGIVLTQSLVPSASWRPPVSVVVWVLATWLLPGPRSETLPAQPHGGLILSPSFPSFRIPSCPSCPCPSGPSCPWSWDLYDLWSLSKVRLDWTFWPCHLAKPGFGENRTARLHVPIRAVAVLHSWSGQPSPDSWTSWDSFCSGPWSPWRCWGWRSLNSLGAVHSGDPALLLDVSRTGHCLPWILHHRHWNRHPFSSATGSFSIWGSICGSFCGCSASTWDGSTVSVAVVTWLCSDRISLINVSWRSRHSSVNDSPSSVSSAMEILPMAREVGGIELSINWTYCRTAVN